MKLKILPLLLIVFGFGFQQVNAQENLLENGNFAADFDKWTIPQDEHRFELRPSELENGQMLFYTGGPLIQIFSDFYSAEAGKTYKLRVHVRVFGRHGPEDGSDPGANFKLAFADEEGDWLIDAGGVKEDYFPHDNQEFEWVELTLKAPDTDSTAQFQVEMANWHENSYTDGNLEVFIDQVEVVETSGTSIEDEMAEVPGQFDLKQNYPNPFNPSTQIEFNLAENSNVTLEVFDIVGQKVATLADRNMSAGTHEVKFDAGDLPSGTYMYRLKAGDYKEVRKMMLVK